MEIRFPPNVLLKQARLCARMTQEDLAQALNTTAVTISRWENGYTTPRWHFQKKLCRLFGKSLAELGLTNLAAQLPQTILDPTIGPRHPFFGREVLLREIGEQLCRARGRAIGLVGGPGLGKTALVHALLAQPAIQEEFRDGILWARLGPQPKIQGHLQRWGNLLGASVPPTPLELRQAIAGTLNARRMLVVIDDVWQLHDVRALDVSGNKSTSILTTRFPKIAYAACEIVYILPELDEQECLALLAPTLSPDRLHSPTLARLLSSVGGNPLAITLIGEYIRAENSATYSGGGQDAKANQNSSSVETVFRWRRCDFLG